MKTFLSLILLSRRISKKNGLKRLDKHCCPTPLEYDQQIMGFQHFGLNAEKNEKKNILRRYSIKKNSLANHLMEFL